MATMVGTGGTAGAVPVRSFAIRPDMAMPPHSPRRLPSFGNYCFKATCEVRKKGQPENACPIAQVVGYNSGPSVARETEVACAAHVASMRGRHTCTPAEVVFLPNLRDMECSGQIFFVMDGKTKRLV